jgi:hypothetical protein
VLLERKWPCKGIITLSLPHLFTNHCFRHDTMFISMSVRFDELDVFFHKQVYVVSFEALGFV